MKTGITMAIPAMIYTNMQRPSAPPGNIGKRRPNSIPPRVIASMNEEKINPVGKLSEPLTLIREGTHMNTKVNTAPSKKDCESPRYKMAGLFEITFILADIEVDNFD
mmetsp:Transcript_2602/g.2713  ORF Transcript_2602/g.2713 Transcript_2602/m.2713 type:complete len:107 (-) Transcript_2602:981-1301(-)